MTAISLGVEVSGRRLTLPTPIGESVIGGLTTKAIWEGYCGSLGTRRQRLVAASSLEAAVVRRRAAGKVIVNEKRTLRRAPTTVAAVVGWRVVASLTSTS